ncbi:MULTISPECIES: DUF2231 domain-containing protein [Stenotrophomonas]|jgi:uncharacterized membrane protein|uniref:DUF2231 domain-containing protein n=1 Tax=Stenotrophomonas maltophilia TaxID=40324 RepID=A0A4S2CYT3_STEMA|nr:MULTISPECIES: DUF2231 domain-containing protein [Stenotrophomonas]TGY33796.1 hypothetical protein E5352_10470 [Stenotrophomonas maltophilia]
MASSAIRTPVWSIHPLHAAVLGGVLPLFLGALLADYAYWSTYEIQWSNFASWLLIGAMVMATLALLCAVVGLARGRRRLGYLLVLVATWIVGFINALHHARDAWAIMPTALLLSAVATVLALVAAWIGFASLRVGGVR